VGQGTLCHVQTLRWVLLVSLVRDLAESGGLLRDEDLQAAGKEAEPGLCNKEARGSSACHC